MPLDDELPPSRLPIDVQPEQFRSAFGVPVDLNGLDALPAPERQSLRSARPPKAVLLDRVLQLLPEALLVPVERVVIMPTRGTARPGGSRNRIVRLSAWLQYKSVAVRAVSCRSGYMGVMGRLNDFQIT